MGSAVILESPKDEAGMVQKILYNCCQSNYLIL
jgi:hypothetical protein